MSNHNCVYCSRHFKFKDIYEKHSIMCEFFYKAKRDKDRDLEEIEYMPTQQEMYKLVRHLTMQCAGLQKEVDKLKQNAGVRTRKIVVDKLNSIENPAMSFENCR